MSKTITIPTDRGNPVRVVINHKMYEYTAGATVSVPDEVAAALQNSVDEAPSTGRRATAPLEAPGRKASSDGVPVETDDNGNLYVPSGSTIGAIYVEGHKVIVPQQSEG